ncbi:hypothetical protein ACLOJK_035530 [Asimina triloba]
MRLLSNGFTGHCHCGRWVSSPATGFGQKMIETCCYSDGVVVVVDEEEDYHGRDGKNPPTTPITVVEEDGADVAIVEFGVDRRSDDEKMLPHKYTYEIAAVCRQISLVKRGWSDAMCVMYMEKLRCRPSLPRYGDDHRIPDFHLLRLSLPTVCTRSAVIVVFLRDRSNRKIGSSPELYQKNSLPRPLSVFSTADRRSIRALSVALSLSPDLPLCLAHALSLSVAISLSPDLLICLAHA